MPGKKPLPKEPSISAVEPKSLGEKVLDFISPVPLDKSYYATNPRDKIFMDIVSKNAIGSLVGMGLGRIGSKIVGKIGSKLDAMPQPEPNVIKKDPYGLAEGPADRRVFIDKMLGRNTKRAKAKSDELWKAYDTTTVSKPGEHKSPDWQKFEDFANFNEQFNKKYGSHAAVTMPEKPHLEPDIMVQTGRWNKPGEGLWDTFRKMSGLEDRMKEIGIKPRLWPWGE